MPALLTLLVLDPKLRKLRLRCALLMYAAILVMGSIPGARAEIGQYATGVVLHSVAYAILTFLLFTGSTGSARSRALKSVLAIALMGAGDELLQTLFPYRGAAVADWLVDCNAAVITAALLWAFLPEPAAAR
ncbi:MAG TPA: VanZ family protein [Telluria sp.]|nr:VanZ family protein [Telluria sp.]